MELIYLGEVIDNFLYKYNKNLQILRILFLHPDGSLLRDVINKDGNPKFKYFYASTDDVFDSMEDVLDLAESWTNPLKDEL